MTMTAPRCRDGHDVPRWTRDVTRKQRRGTLNAASVADFLSAGKDHAKLAVASGKIPALEANAQELFDSVISIERYTDPEVRNLETLVFTVAAHGNLKDIVKRELEWHVRVRDILRDASDVVRLVIDVG